MNRFAIGLGLPFGALLLATAAPASAKDDPGAATTGLAPLFDTPTAGPKMPDSDGFLQRWLLLDPVVKPNRSNADFTPSYVRDALTVPGLPGPSGVVPRDRALAATGEGELETVSAFTGALEQL